jgi:hypothetical protein
MTINEMFQQVSSVHRIGGRFIAYILKPVIASEPNIAEWGDTPEEAMRAVIEKHERMYGTKRSEPIVIEPNADLF